MHYQEYQLRGEAQREKRDTIYMNNSLYETITKCIMYILNPATSSSKRKLYQWFLISLLDSFFDHCIEKSRGKRLSFRLENF